MATKTTRHKRNPFLDDMLIPVGSKSVRISKMGKDDNVLVNQSTGEVSGTHVVAHRKVDTGKFIKVFADYMSFTFDLTAAGNKTLRVLMWAVKETAIGKDQVLLDKHTHFDFLEAHKDEKKPITLSYPTFARGLGELERAQIIAKSQRAGTYFINPNCIFNGDRIAFTTMLERKEKGTENQGELDI